MTSRVADESAVASASTFARSANVLASRTSALFYSVDGMNTAEQYQVSQPIILKRGTSLVAPVLLWLMDALPAVLAGVMFYPLTRIYDVEFGKEFLVLSIVAAAFTLT